MTHENVIEANNLSVAADLGGDLVPVLRGLSFALECGKILGVVGESGAGKSMVGRTIAQRLPQGFAVTEGTLTFEGRDLIGMASQARRALLGRDLAFIPQAPLTALNPVLTIGQQFDEHLARLGGKSRRERRERACAMLDAAHLADAADLLSRYPHQLSGGMCQRVLIAMAFASDPRLVIADEPTTALDATLHPHIIRLIAEMQQLHGTALIFITHDLRLAAQLCDDLMVIYAGRAVEYGPASAVLKACAHPYTRCLQLAMPSISPTRRALYLLPEQMPSLRQLRDIGGCHFAPRCPTAAEDCRRIAPANVEVGANHSAACLRTAAVALIAAPGPATLPDAVGGGRPMLRVEDLSKHYAVAGPWLGSRHVAAVRNVSFTIAEHEFVALIGESGSGKSTLAKLLVGLEQPTGGRILLNGVDVSDRSHRAFAHRTATIQMVFQDPQSALNPRRRVASIVTQAMEAANGHAAWPERRERTKALLAEMGLPADLAGLLPWQLSGGQRQRINIARALCNVPKLLVADEIVSGLDVSIQAQLLNLLARLRAELGFAMLFICHDLGAVRHLCSRVLVMAQGEIVEQGPVDAIFANPQHPHTKALVASVPPDEPGATWLGAQTDAPS
jgi:peptide/nickel transport system ATP-binding protein